MANFSIGDIATEIGPFISDGATVVSELVTAVRGDTSYLVDLFSIRDGSIARLSCYVDNATLSEAMAKQR